MGPRLRLLLHLTIVVLAASGPAASAQPSAPAAAEGEPRESREVADLLEPIRKKHNLPALAAAIVTPAGTQRVAAVGDRVFGKGPRVAVDDKFHLGSNTKSMTATLLATFVEEGKLAWDTPLAQALPELAGVMHADYRDVTIEHLLAHRAGFSGETEAPGMSLADMHGLTSPLPEQRLAYLRLILAEPPAYRPGTKSQYSNRSYIVAGAIAERLGGSSWEELITGRLFRPLGMRTAGFGPMASPGQTDQPWPHLARDGRPVPIPGADNPKLVGPAGTVHASLTDWGRYVACHLRAGRGEPALLVPETFAKLHARPRKGDYSYGWVFAERGWGGGTVLTHAGSNTMNFAVVWMAPKRDVAFLAATNVGGDEAQQACDEAVAALIQLHTKPAR